jgi:AAHS family 4-hydroxybenzoate transporter-like MFS transporter
MAESSKVYVDELIDQQRLTGRNYFVIALLLIALVCDGFDLQLVGVAAPWITEAWKVKPADLVGPVQSANLFGMMLGAIFLGGLGDRIGRKKIIVGGVAMFGVMTLVCILTNSVLQLGIARFFTGVGLGGVLPNVIALTAETTPRVKRAMWTSIVIVGISLGSGLPGVVATGLVPAQGWQALFVVGGVLPLAIALLLALSLPESLLFQTSSGQREVVARRVQQIDPSLPMTTQTQFALRGTGEGGKGSFGELFVPGLRVTTPLLWIMFAGVLLSMHFLNSWISTVLKLGNLSPQQFSLTNSFFHWSGTIATVATALALGRMGLSWVVVLLVAGLGSLLTIATLGFSSATILTLAVCVAGFGVVGCQGALNASAGLLYPTRCRTTGVGAALGIGRIGSLLGPLIGGWVLNLGVPVQQMFYVPLIPLGLALLATLVLLIRRVDIRTTGVVSGH